MYQSGPRQIRTRESAPTGYPIVSTISAGGLFSGVPQPMKQREISFDTSSKEPHLVKARVFVGNMNTNLISRDDIIRLFSAYGTLLGVTVFKGYAFIQFANSTEAELSVSALNGYSWNGSILDVKLAIAGMKSHNVSSTVSSANGMKRIADSWPGGSTNEKKERTDEYHAGNINAQNEHNKLSVMSDTTQNSGLYPSGMADTLICGTCRYVTSDFEEFRDHRRVECANAKPEKESVWQCAMCDEICVDGRTLIEHAVERHDVKILKLSTD